LDTSEDDSSVAGDTTFLFERDGTVDDFATSDLLLLFVRVSVLDFDVEELNDFGFTDDCKLDDGCKQ